ncbi:MAG: hypothetical protein C0409_05570 [Novosphingobium sp.]|nr:hypothetical protein [Novosphingobium sp.]
MVARDRTTAQSVVWMVGLILIPTGLREIFDTGALGLPFLTYWPSLLLGSLVLELRFAVIFACVTAFVAQRLYGGGAWFYEITTARIVFFGMFAFSAAMIVATGATLRHVVREIDVVNEGQERYNRELRHRVRNMLTLIQALASRGPKAASPIDFYKEFALRLEGLANASDLLQIGAEADGRLPQLAHQTVAPFDREGRIRLRGEPCLLPAPSCIPLIMALHELCTNAIKHGALSCDSGHVDLHWFIGPNGSTLYLLWTEKGGPPVVPPVREGLGTRLLMPQAGLDAVDLNFDPAGVWCEFRIEGVSPISR